MSNFCETLFSAACWESTPQHSRQQRVYIVSPERATHMESTRGESWVMVGGCKVKLTLVLEVITQNLYEKH